jgi:hypothetical protein
MSNNTNSSNNNNVSATANINNNNTNTGSNVNTSITSNDNGGHGTEYYPDDTYSLLALHGPIKNPRFFFFGLMVFLFQITFLLLMVLSVVHPNWSSIVDVDNPDAGRESIKEFIAQYVPSHVSPLVRAAQLMATLSYIVFADSTIRDVSLGIELFPRFEHTTSDDKVGCMVFSSILRFIQGVLAIIVTLFLIVTTNNVIEIILNFTAINFISDLDDAGFKVIKWGKYGRQFKAEAVRIEELPRPKCINRKHKGKRYWSFVIFPVGAILIAILCYIIFLQESNDHWVTEIFRVQFLDKEQGLEVYNGCYKKNDTAIDRKNGFRRKIYEGFDINSESAKFGYCMNDRHWILFKGDTTDACEVGEKGNELARSSKTDTFDVSTMFDETWMSATNTLLDVKFFENSGDTEMNEATCSLFIDDIDNGICDSTFNSLNFRYDGGDCCAATCSGSICGMDSSGIYSKYFPNCLDPDMVPLTIRLDNVILNSTLDLDPVKPLLSISCDETNVLSLYIEESMVNKKDTIRVNDGALCTITISNATSGVDPDWFANYTIFNGDRNFLRYSAAFMGSNETVIIQSSSADEITFVVDSNLCKYLFLIFHYCIVLNKN